MSEENKKKSLKLNLVPKMIDDLTILAKIERRTRHNLIEVILGDYIKAHREEIKDYQENNPE